jgi:hypothetical protein
MFYVEHLFGQLGRNKFLSFCFVLFGVILFNFIGFRVEVEKGINQFVSSKIAKPHFYGLVDQKINPEGVRRRLMALPGIVKVTTIDKTEIKSKVGKIIAEMDEELELGDMDLDYAGMKVVFDTKIRSKGQEMLKSYLTRLVGKQNIILGPTISSNRQETTTTTWIRKWGYYLILSSIAIFWLMLTWQLTHNLFHESKVVEKFKRTNRVSEKTMGILVLFMAALIILPQFMLLGRIDLVALGSFGLVMLLLTISMNFKKWI